jgi:endonuclease/exonuclease/phosphatase family metal-dependent hydrolase
LLLQSPAHLASIVAMIEVASGGATAAERERALVVASHNVMHAVGLPRLLRHYTALRDEVGLGVLCLQEDREAASARIAAAAGACTDGGAYDCAAADDGDDGRAGHRDPSGLAILYDRRRLRCTARSRVPLPRLAALTWLQRRYIESGAPEQKYAQLAAFEPLDGRAPFTVVNFHLDCAGDNHHRRAQIARIADVVGSGAWPRRLVACGDTNAFVWRPRRHPAALRGLLAPLAAHGAVDPDQRPTHFFARQHEPHLGHRITVALGRLGLDLPLRYDVVCTNLPVVARGQTSTPASDHDLVWAALRV